MSRSYVGGQHELRGAANDRYIDALHIFLVFRRLNKRAFQATEATYGLAASCTASAVKTLAKKRPTHPAAAVHSLARKAFELDSMHVRPHTNCSSFLVSCKPQLPDRGCRRKQRNTPISCVAAPPAPSDSSSTSSRPLTNGHQDLATAARNDTPFKTIIEPFRMKFVEIMKMTSREQRLKLLEEANYNLFKIPAEYCLIDLLTDSGESLMLLPDV